MATITIAQINSAIHDTLANNLTLIDYTHDYDTLTEALVNTPALQVYWNGMQTVSTNSTTDRRTFGSSTTTPLRTRLHTFIIEMYCDPRAMIDSIFVQMLPIVDEINDILEDQNSKPYFGLDGIQSFNFTCERGTSTYAQIEYPTVQWTLEIGVF